MFKVVSLGTGASSLMGLLALTLGLLDTLTQFKCGIMKSIIKSAISVAFFFNSCLAVPHPQPQSGGSGGLNTLTSPYTLTAYIPGNALYNGAKVNDFNMFQVNVSSYCPFTGDQAYQCPNGTQQAFVGTLTPVS